MKKIIYIFIFSLAFAPLNFTYSLTPADDIKSTRVRSEVNEKREVLTDAVNEFKEGVKNILDTTRDNKDDLKKRGELISEQAKNMRISRAQKFFDRMLRRLNTAIDRFDNIFTRIDKRIAKLQDDGVDVSSIDPLMNEVQAKIVSAEASLAELTEKYKSVPDAENSREAFQEVKQDVRSLVVLIKEIRDDLKEIIRSLKALVN